MLLALISQELCCGQRKARGDNALNAVTEQRRVINLGPKQAAGTEHKLKSALQKGQLGK